MYANREDSDQPVHLQYRSIELTPLRRQVLLLLRNFSVAIYVNDIEEEFIIKGANGIDVGYLKFIISADVIVILGEAPEGLQK